MIDGHGDDLYRYEGGVIQHNFSSNIFTNFDFSALEAHLHGLGSQLLTCYPEPEPKGVEALLADSLNVAPEAVMVTNGATEAIYLVARMLTGCRSAVVSPTFSEYEDACALNGHELSFISSLTDVNCYMDAVWLCNPNNPTGHIIDKDVLTASLTQNPDTLFVIDGSYADYTLSPSITPAEAIAYGNVMLLGSFTKRFAIPGLRVGYVVGHPALLSRLRGLRMPWTVNSYAIAAVEFLMKHHEDYRIDAALLHTEAMRIAAELRELGIRVGDTSCNFILCELPCGTASELKDYLVSRHGILIRDASNFRGLTRRHFRVAAQSKSQNDLLIKAITEWMSL